MKEIVNRWCIYLLAVFALGPLAGLLTAGLHNADGGENATLLTSTAPLFALALGLGAFALAIGVGMLAGYMVDRRAGMIAAGLTLMWAAARSGRVDVILQGALGSEPLVSLAIEGAFVGILAVIAVICIQAAQREPAEEKSDNTPGTRAARLRNAIIGPGAPTGILAGLAAAGVVGWFLAATPLKGQTIGAAIGAGVAAAMAGRLTKHETPAPSLMIPIAMLAILGPLAPLVLPLGDASVIEAVYAQDLFALARIAPLDWAAGALVGIPLGAAWAGSMIEKGDTARDGLPARAEAAAKRT